jgi:outer membrane protein assembly factor BamB
VRGSAVVSGEAVYFGSGDGNLYSVDFSTGRELWRADLGAAVSSTPAISGGWIFATSRNRRLTALDRATGRVRWRFDMGPELPFSWGWDYWLSSPAVFENRVFVGGGDGKLYALEAKTGRRLWQVATGGRVRSSPAVADRTVYVGSMDGRLYAVDAATGKLRFAFETEGSALDSEKEGYDRTSITSSPAVSEDGVFFGSRDGHLYGVDRRSGARLWRFGHKVDFVPGSPEVGWVVGSPAVLGGTVLVGSSDGKFFNAVRAASGQEVWRFSTTDRVFSSGAVAGGLVFFGSDDGHVFALDASTGVEKWRFQTGGMIVSSPIVRGATILFGSDDGRLYALQTGPARSGARPRRAVYWREPGAWKWFEGDAATRDYFARQGYRVLDATALLDFLRDTDHAPLATVVMASDRLPDGALAGEAPDSALRRFLSSGGRMVWLGVPPDAVVFDPKTDKPTGFDPARTERLLSVSHAGGTGDRLPVRATPDGKRWGLPEWWIGGLSVPAEAVSTVLGRDESGRASAWIQRYSASPGSGFVRLWGRTEPIPDLSWVQAVAEHIE